MKGADRQPPRPRRTASCSTARLPFDGADGLLFALLISAQLLLASSARAADAYLLFEQAGQLKDANQCKQALELYQELLSSPALTKSLREPATYNQAACNELIGRFAAAYALFTALADTTEDKHLWRDAVFRIASIDQQRGDWPAAHRKLRRLLHSSSSDDDRVRIHVQLAAVSINLQRRQRAARHLKRAARLLGSLSKPIDPWYRAQHQLLLGDLFVLEASRVPISTRRPRKAVKQLAQRGVLLERAQDHFVTAISSEEPRWMQAATLHLGIALLSMAVEMKKLEELLDTHQLRGSRSDLDHLQRWLATRRPAMARKAFESLQLCLDVLTEAGVQTTFSSSCRDDIDEFPMDLLIGPNPPP